MSVDPAALAAIRPGRPDPRTRAAMVDRYTDGDCLILAFAVHWMTGWPVEAVSERGGDNHLHFAAIGVDGRAWDAAGPRSKEDAGTRFADDPAWERVDPRREIAVLPGATEDAITQACRDALALLGPALDGHVVRVPHVPGAKDRGGRGMTMGEVGRWALSHGFSEVGPDLLRAEGEGYSVTLRLMARDVRAELHAGGRTRKLGTARPSNLRVGDHGVIEGLGLSTSFVTDHARHGTVGSPVTAAPWMTPAFLESVSAIVPDLRDETEIEPTVPRP